MTDATGSARGARFELVATAVLFSSGGAAIKLCTLNGWQVAGTRSAIAAVCLLLALPASRQGWRWWHLAVGCPYAATMVLFTLSNKLTTAANSIFLQSTAPLYLVPLGAWLLHERARKGDLVLMGVLGLGLGLFFLDAGTAAATAPDPLRGNLLALGSGVAWAFTVLGLRWLAATGSGPGGGTAPTLVAGNLLAAVACLPPAWPLRGGSVADWAVLGYLGAFQIGLAYLLMARALGRVPALEAALLLLLEPVLNPVWAWAVHGERPGPWALAGAAVILGATAWRTLRGPEQPEG